MMQGKGQELNIQFPHNKSFLSRASQKRQSRHASVPTKKVSGRMAIWGSNKRSVQVMKSQFPLANAIYRQSSKANRRPKLLGEKRSVHSLSPPLLSWHTLHIVFGDIVVRSSAGIISLLFI
ncbi:hypothetical protein V6N12_075129 [Hibiscus sabdariffa]|uniref:Uncharacterized protein n=1 Tax=Hibiscus sabdariffa TaxID=183260 RepID=A0ABR2BZK3_9ROSI